MHSLRLLCCAVVLISTTVFAGPLDATAQAKVDAKLKEIVAWAADPIVVEAVRAHNVPLPPELAALTQEKWAALNSADPIVRSFTRNAVGQFLRSKKDATITESFVSDAAGYKVGFVAKTTNWCHKGKPKHDVPMTGKIWQGPIEIDESTGLHQLQVAVPVLDAGKAIGSLVVGLDVGELTR